MIGASINQVECPLTGGCATNCEWIKREGSVRDFPEVGLCECSNCHLVSHEIDLRQRIDYASGTMHAWATGYGENLESPFGDISRRVQAISELAKEYKIKKILDFGSGRGEILKALEVSFEVKGLEPEIDARTSCQNEGLDVATSSREYTEKDETFDLVTPFHVVEHFYAPRKELTTINSLLAPGGLLIVETPNSQDALLTTYRSKAFSNFTYWSHHPVLHSEDSLIGLISNSGLKVVMSMGVQRYGLANHLYWLSQGLPGGHVHWDALISGQTESAYQEDLASSGTCDTLWIVAQKPL